MTRQRWYYSCAVTTWDTIDGLLIDLYCYPPETFVVWWPLQYTMKA